MEENELKLLKQINTYPQAIPNLTSEEQKKFEYTIKSNIQKYFKYRSTYNINNIGHFIEIATTLFHRIITSKSNNATDWLFLKEEYSEETLIKNTDYISIFIFNIKKLYHKMSKKDMYLILNELNFLEREMNKHIKNSSYVYVIKRFASIIFQSLHMNQILDEFEDNIDSDYSIVDKCLDIIIKDPTNNKTIKINPDLEKKIFDLIYNSILGTLFRDDEKFVIACNTLLNLNNEKGVIELIKKTKALEDNLEKTSQSSKVTKPLYDIKDVKNRH